MNSITSCPLCSSTEIEKLFQGKDFFLSQEEFEVWKCSKCMLRFTSPVPDKDKLGTYYKSVEYVSHSDTRKGVINTVYHYVKRYSLRKKYQKIQRLKAGGNLLDIGCGSGAFPAFMSERGWRVKAVEPDEEARRFAIKHYGLDVYGEEALGNFEQGSFDVITLWHVLEHVYDLNGRMEEIKRLLHDDSYLILALPNPESPDALYYREYWAAWDLPRHLYHFSPFSIKKLAQQHGFEVINISPMVFDAYYVSMLSEKYRGGNILRAIQYAWRSNSQAAKEKMNYSSLIYVLKMTKAI